MTPVSAQELLKALTAPFVPGEALDLRARRVTGALDLSGQSLCGFDLTGSVFEGPVSLRAATCLGLTWFRDCVFERGLDGSNAVFAHDLRCDDSEFRGPVTLRDAEFRGTCVFDNAVIASAVDLTNVEVLSNFSCATTRFEGSVDLSGAILSGGLWADRADFRNGVHAIGTEVHGRTWLRDSMVREGREAFLKDITSYGYVWA